MTAAQAQAAQAVVGATVLPTTMFTDDSGGNTATNDASRIGTPGDPSPTALPFAYEAFDDLSGAIASILRDTRLA
jgi:hypothetical protein